MEPPGSEEHDMDHFEVIDMAIRRLAEGGPAAPTVAAAVLRLGGVADRDAALAFTTRAFSEGLDLEDVICGRV